MTPERTGGVSVQADAQALLGPDGKMIIAVVVVVGGAQFMVPLPAGQAGGFIDTLAARVHAAEDKARQHNLGLTVAAPSDLSQLLQAGQRSRLP